MLFTKEHLIFIDVLLRVSEYMYPNIQVSVSDLEPTTRTLLTSDNYWDVDGIHTDPLSVTRRQRLVTRCRANRSCEVATAVP